MRSLSPHAKFGLRLLFALPAALGLVWLALPAGGGRATAADSSQLKDLVAPARMLTDSEGIPHIFASNDHDAMLLLGYAHARDRLFQMDLLRHQASGTSAEIVGKAGLSVLRRLAARSRSRRRFKFFAAATTQPILPLATNP